MNEVVVLTPERILEVTEDVLRRFGLAKATVVDVARAAVVLRRRRLADQGGARGTDVERSEPHERGIRGGRPFRHDPRKREDRRHREGERERNGDPAGAPIEVAEPEDPARRAVSRMGRRRARFLDRAVVRERWCVDGARVS